MTAADCLRILQTYHRIAMVGLSANPMRPSHFAAIYMLSKGYDIIPVNPRGGEMFGEPVRAGDFVYAWRRAPTSSSASPIGRHGPE